MAALIELMKLTHAGITTDEFDAACRGWPASARHPRFGRRYAATVYQPMRELLALLDRSSFCYWIFPGGGPDFMRTWAADVYSFPWTAASPYQTLLSGPPGTAGARRSPRA
ncbi:MAG: hypothetical protein ACLPKI_14465 [Streptosporangiaceae bacterium]